MGHIFPVGVGDRETMWSIIASALLLNAFCYKQLYKINHTFCQTESLILYPSDQIREGKQFCNGAYLLNTFYYTFSGKIRWERYPP